MPRLAWRRPAAHDADHCHSQETRNTATVAKRETERPHVTGWNNPAPPGADVAGRSTGAVSRRPRSAGGQDFARKHGRVLVHVVGRSHQGAPAVPRSSSEMVSTDVAALHDTATHSPKEIL